MENASTARKPRPSDMPLQVCKQLYDRALARSPWLLGLRSLDEDHLSTDSLTVEGRIPESLRGTLYRNGPSRYERGGQRYRHRFDGDGMVHAFTIHDARVSHLGRYIQTDKYRAESAAGRFLTCAFGTSMPEFSHPQFGQLDSMDTANISVVGFADELLALWEPGSAYRLEPQTLQTIGVKTWRDDLKGVPFSAHPKVESDGSMWNFGADPVGDKLRIFHIDRSGQLKAERTLDVPRLPPIHDFAVTEKHLVFLLPPIRMVAERLFSGESPGEATRWVHGECMRVLVVSKTDWTERYFELPAGMLFHVANAWEDAGTIQLDYMRADDPRSLIAGFTVMWGEYAHREGAALTRIQLNLGSGEIRQEIFGGDAEFPKINPLQVGHRHEHVVFVNRSKERPAHMFGFDEIRSVDVNTGRIDTYHYGQDWLLDEHVVVPKNQNSTATWVVGTALDLSARQTVLSVFDGDNLAGGPVAFARLPYALPLALHSDFVKRS